MPENENLEDTENEELEDTESEDEDDEATEDAEWTPPTKAEFSKLQRQLKRARTEAKTAKDTAKAKPSEDEVENARVAAREEETKRANLRIAKSEARALLASAGAKGDLSRLIKLIDFDDVDVSDDDEVDGLEDQIEELRSDYPDMFSAAKAKSNTHTRGDAAQKSAGSGKPKSSAELIAAMATGLTK